MAIKRETLPVRMTKIMQVKELPTSSTMRYSFIKQLDIVVLNVFAQVIVQTIQIPFPAQNDKGVRPLVL